MNFSLTLEWLHARCADIDGCLRWNLAAAHGTDPQARVGGRAGQTVLVRRLVWEATHERPLPRNHIARRSCDTPLCVHPDHVLAQHKRDVLAGRSLSLQHRIAIASGRRANSHLSDEDAACIRHSEGPLAEAASAFDIDPTYVSHIRLGKARRDYRNPFFSLGAR